MTTDAPDGPTIPTIDVETLVDRWDGLLIDAYGVLVHSSGSYPGAASLLERLDEANTPWLVVTNDASRLPETCARSYAASGVHVDPDDILTSGMLVESWFERRDLKGAPTVCLGTPDARRYVERGGGRLVEPTEDFEALVLGDDEGFEVRPTINAVLSHVFERLDAGGSIELALPNPDRFFQTSEETWGMAVGAYAAMFEAALADRYPSRRPTFDVLGKPNATLFEQGIDRLGSRNIAMIGDQLGTDIAGARGVGIDSVLMARRDLSETLSGSDVRPDYLLETLDTSQTTSPPTPTSRP